MFRASRKVADVQVLVLIDSNGCLLLIRSTVSAVHLQVCPKVELGTKNRNRRTGRIPLLPKQVRVILLILIPIWSLRLLGLDFINRPAAAKPGTPKVSRAYPTGASAISAASGLDTSSVIWLERACS
jgi:hypothetical protein